MTAIASEGTLYPGHGSEVGMTLVFDVTGLVADDLAGVVFSKAEPDVEEGIDDAGDAGDAGSVATNIDVIAVVFSETGIEGEVEAAGGIESDVVRGIETDVAGGIETDVVGGIETGVDAIGSVLSEAGGEECNDVEGGGLEKGVDVGVSKTGIEGNVDMISLTEFAEIEAVAFAPAMVGTGGKEG